MGRRSRRRRHPATEAAEKVAAEKRLLERKAARETARNQYLPTLQALSDLGYDRELAWGTMIYACQGTKRQIGDGKYGCGWEHRVWLCNGVEGPPKVREYSWVPAPFFCGACPECGGRLAHERWKEDEEWEESVPLPDDVAYFSVPLEQLFKGYSGAEYADPTGRTTPNG